MRLTLDRDPKRVRRTRDDVLFAAVDDEGASVTVAISVSAWRSLQAEAGFNAYDELELIAINGGWEPWSTGKVWRVILI